MGKWEIRFNRICEQEFEVDAETEAMAILKALEKWHTENRDTPKINYIFNINEGWGKPIK